MQNRAIFNRWCYHHRRVLTKTLLVMKLTTFLLFIALCSIRAEGVSQTIYFTGKNASIHAVIKAVERQSGYVFLFKDATIKKVKPITINAIDVPVDEFLNEIFEGQVIKYTIINNNILLTLKDNKQIPPFEKELESSLDASIANPIKVSVHSSLEMLRGATITNTTQKKIYLTDVKGNAEVVANAGDRLHISYIGYNDTVIMVTAAHVRDLYLPVNLSISEDKLDEIQVNFLGNTTRRNSTSNITTIKSSEIEKVPVTNILDVLKGRVLGLEIGNPINYNNAAVRKVQLRGRNVLSPGTHNEPLYVIDGIPKATTTSNPMNYENLEYNTGLTQGGVPLNIGTHPLYSINPLDIESVDILKDADATSLFGAQGSNGVVMITTKRGKPGVPRVDLNYSRQVQSPQRFLHYMNTADYLAMRREALMNDVLNPSLDAGGGDLASFDQEAYTDWQKVFFNKAIADDYQAAFSGGFGLNTYRISVGHSNATQTYNQGRANTRTTANISFTNKSADGKTTLQFISSNSIANVEANAVLPSFQLPPNTPWIYTESGELNFEPFQLPTFSIFPFSGLFGWSKDNTLESSSAFVYEYEIINGLSFRNAINLNIGTNKNARFTPSYGNDPKYGAGFASTFFGATTSLSYRIAPTLNYIKPIGLGRVNGTIGAEYFNTKVMGETIMAFGFPNDNLMESFSSAAGNTIMNNNSQVKTASIYGNLSYSYDNRYLVNLNIRRDGNSNFGPNKRYGNFGSLGVAWTASNEQWFKNVNQDWLTYIRIKANYGFSGATPYQNYLYVSKWSNQNANNTVLSTYDGRNVYALQQVENSKFHWSFTKDFNAGLSIGLLNAALNLDLNYYVKRTGDQLTDHALPYYTGFGTVYGNSLPVIQNRGFEFLINSNVITTKNWNLTAGFQIARNINTLYAFDGLEESPYRNAYRIGYSLTTFAVNRFIGISPLTGLNAMEDYNNDGNYTATYGNNFSEGNTDRYKYLNMDQIFDGNMNLHISYKNIATLSLVFTFTKGYYTDFLSTVSYGSSVNNIMFSEIQNNRWRQPGDNALYEKFTTRGNSLFHSDAYYAKIFYLNCANPSLAINIPDKFTKKAKMKAASFIVSGYNLFKISSYRNADAEMGGTPQMKTINSTIRLSF